MSIQSTVWLLLKIVFLTVIMCILFIAGTQLVGFEAKSAQTATAAEQSAAALILLIVCLIDVLILVWFILRSRLFGIQMILTTALIYYGIKTVMSQMEVWYFISNLTPGMLPKLFLMTIPVTILFPLIAVPILGKFKNNNMLVTDQKDRLSMPTGEWLWKISLLTVVIYPLFYFVFGYFIAWQNPQLRAFYHGTDPGSFFAQMANIFSNDPWLYFFQIFRGLLWVGLAIVIIKSMKDSALISGLFVGITFSLLMNDSLFIPNTLMPAAIRWTHFIETASSNFIWGWSIAVLLVWHPKQM
jgi:hypothetical protein